MAAALVFILFVAVLGGVIAAGVLLRSIADTLIGVDRLEEPERFAQRVQLCAFGLFAFAVALVLLFLLRVARVMVAVDVLLLAVGGGLLMQASVLVRRNARVDESLLTKAVILKRVGFLLCLSVFLCFTILQSFVLLIPLVLALLFIATGKRRADQSAVLWTLALSPRGGRTLADELDSVASGLAPGRRRRTYRLADQIRDGLPLEAALASAQGLIPAGVVTAAQVGAENGTLSKSIRLAVARHTSRDRGLLATPSSPTLAVYYLLIVPLVIILIVLGLVTWIVPKLKLIFEGFDTQLPGATQQLIEISDAIAFRHGWLPIVLIVLSVTALGAVLEAYYRGWGENNIPLVGRWFRRLDVPELLRLLSGTVTANQSIPDTLAVLSRTHRRTAVRTALSGAADACREGTDCWQALQQAGLLTAREVDLVVSAQRVGNLPWALQQLADSLERRFTYRWLGFVEIAQPAFVVLMGVVVGFTVVALFLPLIKLLNDLS